MKTKNSSEIIKKYINNNELFKELITKQLKDISIDKKLQYTDLKRICKYISSSIFDENKCCLWNGYVTNITNYNKGTYINFYFRKKKVALHRLLYTNFIGELTKDDYLKFNCENKGKCCNVLHLKKFKYNKKQNISNAKKNNINVFEKKSKKIKIICGNTPNTKNLLTVTFD